MEALDAAVAASFGDDGLPGPFHMICLTIPTGRQSHLSALMRSSFCRFWRFWRGRRASPTLRVLARRRARLGCAGSAPSPTGRRATIILGDIFATLDARGFRRCFVAWVAALTKTPAELIAIDGKTSRRSSKKGSKEAIHMVSAFAARQRLESWRRHKVGEKSNEIKAIFATHRHAVDRRGNSSPSTRSQDASCDIAQKIVDKKADYHSGAEGQPRNAA